MKIIIPLLVIIFLLIRLLIKSKKVKSTSKNGMDSCISCGTFVSEDLAIKKDNNIYCSEECIMKF